MVDYRLTQGFQALSAKRYTVRPGGSSLYGATQRKGT